MNNESETRGDHPNADTLSAIGGGPISQEEAETGGWPQTDITPTDTDGSNIADSAAGGWQETGGWPEVKIPPTIDGPVIADSATGGWPDL